MHKLQPFMFIAPSAILMVVVFGIPLIWAMVISLFDYNLMNPAPPFVGLDNYINLLTTDRVFWQSVGVTVVWVVGSIIPEFVFAVILALLLNEAARFRALFRAVTALPWAVPPVVAAMIWLTMYDPTTGALNQVLMAWGVIKSPITWLADPALVMPSLIVVVIWKYTPFMTLSLLAGLQSIPQELYDAASIDGANVLHRFGYVTLPLLMPVITVILGLGTIWRARHFDIVWALTHGGPGSATELLAIDAYRRTVMSFAAGMGSAVAILFSLLFLAIMALMVRRLLSI